MHSLTFERILTKHTLSLWAVCLVALSLAFTPVAEARTVLKVASLAPEGSVWDNILRDMGAEWQEATDGEVNLRMYAGGIAGDETDVVRKMRIGQLHGAALSVGGLSYIDESFEVFEIPMFFDSYEELYHVLETLRPQFEARLKAKGYVLLHWGQGGWVHFFSKEPIVTVENLQKQKVFVGAGNDEMVQLWRQNGFQPVALSATDILTGLETGMIEALPTTPLAALSLQWFRQTQYMQGLGLAPLVGATVISERAWKRLSPEVQKTLLDSARQTEKQLMEEIPGQDAQAVEEMKKKGIAVTEVSEEAAAEWREAAQAFIDFKRKGMESKDILDLVLKERDAFRAQQGAGQAAAGQ